MTEQVERLENLWYEQDASAMIPTVSVINETPPPGTLRFVRGAAAEGWTLTGGACPLHFITDAEIFGWTRPEPRRSDMTRAGANHQTQVTPTGKKALMSSMSITALVDSRACAIAQSKKQNVNTC